MTTGSLSFPTGQALLDWLLATNQPFNVGKVSHKRWQAFPHHPHAKSSVSAFYRTKPAMAS